MTNQETIEPGCMTRDEREADARIEALMLEELKSELRAVIGLQAEIARRMKTIQENWQDMLIEIDGELYHLETGAKTLRHFGKA